MKKVVVLLGVFAAFTLTLTGVLFLAYAPTSAPPYDLGLVSTNPQSYLKVARMRLTGFNYHPIPRSHKVVPTIKPTLEEKIAAIGEAARPSSAVICYRETPNASEDAIAGLRVLEVRFMDGREINLAHNAPLTVEGHLVDEALTSKPDPEVIKEAKAYLKKMGDYKTLKTISSDSITTHHYVFVVD